MSRKVLITGSIAEEAMDMLKANDCETVVVPPYTETEVFLETVRREQPDGFIIRMGDINGGIISASGRLRVISKHGVGVNNIDVATATERGVPVTITLGANSRSVAEHAFALIFALVKDIRALDTMVRDGRWDRAAYNGRELTGKHLGLAGFGSIGRELADLVRPFRMRVSAYDPFAADSAFGDGVERAETLEGLLSEADILSVHCPMTPKTRGLIGREGLGRMKKTAYLVNTARGGIVDETALVEALREGTIAGAGLDGFGQEPPRECPGLC